MFMPGECLGILPLILGVPYLYEKIRRASNYEGSHQRVQSFSPCTRASADALSHHSPNS